MREDVYVTYKDVRDLKIERDVLEKIFLEKQFSSDEVARAYYNYKKQKILENLELISSLDDNESKRSIKRLNKELLNLCTQFGHDAPCPSREDEMVVCRCCGQKFTYEELIESYYRKTRFSKMILFDYVKKQPFFKETQFIPLFYEDN